MRNTWLYSNATLLLLFSNACIKNIHQSETERRRERIEDKILKGRVVSINDGDTIKIKTASKTERVRLVGTDTPEHAQNGGEAQSPWDELAEKNLKKLLPPGADVEVQVVERDIHRRILGVVTHNGQNINLQMVRDGFSYPFIFCRGDGACEINKINSTYQPQLLEACKEAREERRGFFKERHELELPWEFRERAWGHNEILWVGSYSKKIFVKKEDRKEIDVCDRVYFAGETDQVPTDAVLNERYPGHPSKSGFEEKRR